MTQQRMELSPEGFEAVARFTGNTDATDRFAHHGVEYVRLDRHRQWIATDPDGREYLVSFWGGMDSDPEVAPRVDHTRWGMPYAVREVTA